MGRSFLPVIDTPQPAPIPARPMAGQRLYWLCPLASIRPEIYIPERIPLPEDVSIILSVLSIRRSALSGANFTWLFSSFCCRRSRPLSRHCSLFTHRLPTALSFPLSSVFSEEEEFAVISQCLKSRYRDSAPRPFGPRYQTAGSIGALARDEPVTPGVTFLSPPAPNSGDSEDR